MARRDWAPKVAPLGPLRGGQLALAEPQAGGGSLVYRGAVGAAGERHRR